MKHCFLFHANTCFCITVVAKSSVLLCYSMYCKKMAVKWTTYSAGVHDYYCATIIEAASHKLGILTKVILEGTGSYMKEKNNCLLHSSPANP